MLVISFIVESIRSLRKTSSRDSKLLTVLFLGAILAALLRDLTFSSIFENDSIMILLVVILSLSSDDKLYSNIVKVKSTRIIFIILAAFAMLNVFFWRNKIAEKHNIAFVDNFSRGNILNAELNIKRSLHLCSNNSEYYAHLGLLNFQKANQLFDKPLDTVYIKNAIENYQQALRLSPNDACYLHNVGILYLYLNDTDNALFYLERATQRDPNNSIYKISLGNLFKKIGNFNRAVDEYHKAIRVNPGILDSKFFHDFQNWYTGGSSQFLSNIVKELEESGSDNSIIRARLAKLYLSINQIPKAKVHLEYVTKELPNLNRPWYYLGLIKELENDSLAAQKLFLRSSFLDETDVLPVLKLGDLHFKAQEYNDAKVYYKKALRNWFNMKTEHATIVDRIYFVNGVKNDIIPRNLLIYINPIINCRQIYINISKCYDFSKKKDLSIYYQQLSNDSTRWSLATLK